MVNFLNETRHWIATILMCACSSFACPILNAQNVVNSQFIIGVNAGYKLVRDQEFSSLLYGGYGTNLSLGHSCEKRQQYSSLEFNLGYYQLKKLLNHPSSFVMGNANSYESYISYMRSYEVYKKGPFEWQVGGVTRWLADVINYTGYVNFSFSHEINLCIGGASRMKYRLNDRYFITHLMQIPILGYSSRPDPFGMYPENETMFHYLATGKLATINKISYIVSELALYRNNKKNNHQIACFYKWTIGQNTIGAKKVTGKHQLGIRFCFDVSKSNTELNE